MNDQNPSQTTTLVKTVTSTKAAIGLAIISGAMALANAVLPAIPRANPVVTLKLVTPVAQSTIGGTVRLYATSSEKVSTMKFGVSFAGNGAEIPAVYGQSLDGKTWSATWDTTKVADGAYSLNVSAPTGGALVNGVMTTQFAYSAKVPFKVSQASTFKIVMANVNAVLTLGLPDETRRNISVIFNRPATDVLVALTESGIETSRIKYGRIPTVGQTAFPVEIGSLKYNTEYGFVAYGTAVDGGFTRSLVGTFKTGPAPALHIMSMKAMPTVLGGKPDETRREFMVTFDYPAENVQFVVSQGSAQIATGKYIGLMTPGKKEFLLKESVKGLKYVTAYEYTLSGCFIGMPTNCATSSNKFQTGPAPLGSDTMIPAPKITLPKVKLTSPVEFTSLDTTVNFVAVSSAKLTSLKFTFQSILDDSIANRTVDGTSTDGLNWSAKMDISTAKEGRYYVYPSAPVTMPNGEVLNASDRQMEVKVAHAAPAILGIKRAPQDGDIYEGNNLAANNAKADIGKFILSATSEDIIMSKLTVNVSLPSVVTSLELYDGQTKIADRVEMPSSGNATFEGISFIVPKYSKMILTVKANLDIRTSKSVSEASALLSSIVTTPDSFTATGAATGLKAKLSADVNIVSVSGTRQFVRWGKLMIGLGSMPSTTLTPGNNVLTSFSMTAVGGDVSFKTMTFKIKKSATVAITSVALRLASNSSDEWSTPFVCDVNTTECNLVMALPSERNIRWGTTSTYQLLATVTAASSGDSVWTSILGDSLTSGGKMYWSDKGANPHTMDSKDWYSYGGVLPYPATTLDEALFKQ